MSGGVPRPLAVDLSCSSLTAASASAATILSPTVAPVSVLVTTDGSALPEGGDRLECSDRVDAMAGERPESCLRDPLAVAHRGRVSVAGLSVSVPELLAAPVARAIRWHGAVNGGLVPLLVPTRWGRVRTGRLESAARALGVVAHPVRAALVIADALPSSTARWAICVESEGAMTTVALVERRRDGLSLTAREVVPRWDPARDPGPDDEVSRILGAVERLRRTGRETGSGSTEILVRGRIGERVVDACDDARMLSYAVPETSPAEAAVRIVGHG